MAFLAVPVAAAGLAAVTTPLLPAGATAAIERGQIHVEPGFLPPPLVRSLREDAMSLFEAGLFSPDGLTNTAVGRSQQGFDRRDRQTFRGDGWSSATGDQAARLQFAARMRSLREELAEGLGRPTLASEGERRHEMTYNWRACLLPRNSLCSPRHCLAAAALTALTGRLSITKCCRAHWQ